MFVLYAAYKILFEKEKTLVFNRIYLLFAIVFSLFIPFFSFEIKTSELPFQNLEPYSQFVERNIDIPQKYDDVVKKNVNVEDSFSKIAFAIYGVITFVFFLRFLINLSTLYTKIRNSSKIDENGYTIVLHQDSQTISTFFKWLFVNRTEFENCGIKKEILEHEIAHIKQFHSIDIIFIELLLVIFWFNPILYFYKKSIQLNHEFLADNAVLRHQIDVAYYQNLLLEAISVQSGLKLTSNLTFHITKQRLKMMTKHTSRKMAITKTIFLITLIVFLGGFITMNTIGQTQPSIAIKKAQPISTTLTQADVNMDNARIHIWDFTKPNGQIMSEKKYSELTEKEKALLGNPSYFKKDSPTDAMLKEWASTDKYGIWMNEKRISNEKLKEYTSADIAHYFSSRLYKNAQVGNRRFQIDLMTHKYYEEVYLKGVKESPMFIFKIGEPPQKKK